MIRKTLVKTLIIPAGGTQSEVFPAAPFTSFILVMPNSFTGTQLRVEVGIQPSGPFFPLHDAAGTQVSIGVVPGRAYTLPATLSGVLFFRLVSNATETAERALTVVGKS